MYQPQPTRNIAVDILDRKIHNHLLLAESLEAGADPNQPDTENPKLRMTPLSAAARNLDAHSVRVLLEAGADHRAGGTCGRTALHWAVMGQTTPDAARLLVEAGADIEARDDDGCTPLHRAAQYSKGTECRVVAGLLELGADPSAKNNEGKTPDQVSETKEARDLLRRAQEARTLAGESPEPTAPPRDRRRMASKGEAKNQ